MSGKMLQLALPGCTYCDLVKAEKADASYMLDFESSRAMFCFYCWCNYNRICLASNYALCHFFPPHLRMLGGGFAPPTPPCLGWAWQPACELLETVHTQCSGFSCTAYGQPHRMAS